MLMLKEETAA